VSVSNAGAWQAILDLAHLTKGWSTEDLNNGADEAAIRLWEDAQKHRQAGRLPAADEYELAARCIVERFRRDENTLTASREDIRILQGKVDAAWEARRVLQWAIKATDGRTRAILEAVQAGKTFAEAVAENPDPEMV